MNAFRLEHLLREATAGAPATEAIRDGDQALSYGELDAIADRVAATLASQGVTLGDRVGLYLEKSIPAVAALYGIMRAGAAYVPIDPFSPVARAAHIATDAGIAALVSDSGRIAALRELDGSAAPGGITRAGEAAGFVTWSEVERGTQPLPDPPVVDTDLAYILYTSGSTGQPKGVAISHRSALSFIRWARGALGLHTNDVFANHAPLHFDLSTLDLFGAAAAGGTVCLVPAEAAMFPIRLADWIRSNHISVWYSVPSALTMLVRYGQLEHQPLRDLRLVLFAGEVFPPRFLAALMNLVHTARFFNLYGPTETNVCTYEEVLSPPASSDPPVPIGQACENTRCHVIDDCGAEVTGAGSQGELVVTGSTVAEGYWRDVEQTRRRFPAPFTHRTGDIVEILDDSLSPRYRFVGRHDHLIKTRGYRVELGEVEAALYAHPAVEECVAVAVPDELLGNRIVAFSSTRGGSSEAEGTLQAHCRSKLPSYMIPDRILLLERLPRTANDKLDRTGLASEAARIRGHGVSAAADQQM